MEKIINIRPKTRVRTGAIKEKNSCFICPSNTVLTGRCHSNDENGNTWYEYCTLGAFDENNTLVEGDVVVDDVVWSEWFKESSGAGYDAIGNRVLIGRQHNGDENGKTRYATAIIKFNGKEVALNNYTSSSSIKESKGIWIKSPQNSFMTGRHHRGDENGKTFYNFAEAFYQFTSSDKAPTDTIIIPNVKYQSVAQKESSSSFLCPSNTVMIGRYHINDENGTTIYEYADLKAITSKGINVKGVISVKNIYWEKTTVESDSAYDAPYGKVIVGRKHSGDENGLTQYAIGEVFFNGFRTYLKDYKISSKLKESDGVWFHCDNNSVITGRHHYGDENGNTYYRMGTICCDDNILSEENNIIVHVVHDSTEKYFPMNPSDFIKLSRLRKHEGGGNTDFGYNKVTKTFVKGNDKSPEYYDIPIEIVSSFRNKGKNKLLTLRPKDENSIGHDEVFLQPDDHLFGDNNATSRVAVYKYIDNDYKFSYWMFWGYNFAESGKIVTLKGNHQGDWECLTIELSESNRIKQVTLSCHDSSKTYQPSELNIKFDENLGKDVLTVYCASGSHALYNKTGSYSRAVGKDKADGKGYDWIITNKVENLSDEGNIWKYYSGAWGEIGFFQFTTGPLGPWYKCDAIIFEAQKENSPTISELIKDNNQVLLIHNKESRTSLSLKESEGKEACGSANQLLYSRVHHGDENGTTYYHFSTLKAIDHNGNLVKEGKITIENLKWSDWHKQSESSDFFMSIDNNEPRVITGRQHKDDENGMTRYQTGVVKYGNKNVEVKLYADADLITRENGGRVVLPKENLVIIGIKHEGDENGLTTYCQGYIIAK